MSGIGLTPAQLASIFPFHFGLGPDLRITQVGSGWTRISRVVGPGAAVADHFRLVRPSLPLTADNLRNLLGSLVVLEQLSTGMPLRGQMMRPGEAPALLFIGGPWVRDASDLERFGLSLEVWPPHEATADLLFLLRSKDTSLRDAGVLAARLEARQADLRTALNEFERSQEALKAREASLRAILDTAAEGIVTADERGIIRSFNAAASHIFGWAPDEVIGSNVSVLIPPPIRDEHDAYIARYLAGGVPAVIGRGREVEGLRRDGTRFPLQLAVSEVQLPEGRTFTGILRDLTELNAAQHALEASEARTRLVVDAALDAVVNIDRQGLVTLWNAQAERIFGWSREEAVGRSLAELVIPPGLRQAHQDGMHRFLTTGEAHVLNTRIEITAVNRDGLEFPVELSITAIGEGDRLGFSGFVRDISDRKRSERLLRTQYELTRILAGGTGLADVASRLLRAACEYLGWSVGALWLWDPHVGGLRCAEIWYEPGLAADGFLAQTRSSVFQPGMGLPGRVYASGEYALVPTVADDRNFPRAPDAAAAGLAAGLALPMAVDGRVGGVIEFFSRRVASPTTDELQTLSSLAGQLGQFIERRQAEQRVRDGAERLDLALAGGDLGTWDLDRLTDITALDDRYQRMLGYAPGGLDQLTTEQWLSLVHPEDRPAVEGALTAHMAGDTPSFEVEYRMLHRDGTWKYFADSGRVTVRGPHGRPSRISGTHQDVSRRKAAEQALQLSQVRLRAVIDNMLEGLVLVDDHWRILEANPAFARVFGYAQHELVGLPIVRLMPDRPEYQVPEQLSRAYRESLGKMTEHEGRRRSGEIFPLQLQVYGVTTPAGRVVAGHVRDLSAEREGERLKKRFVASVSHELRTPLTAIRGSLGLLAKGAVGTLPADAADVVLMAERNAVRLVEIINDLLDFERIQAGLLSLTRKVFPLDAAIAQAKESVGELARQSRIVIDSPPSALDVWGDEARIVQVLVNLLGNAIKFSPEGSRIEVTVNGLADAAEVRVRDSGRGVPHDLREVIFQPFRQVDESDARHHGGSGMGLAVCRGIVTQHGGTIGVDSQPGEGAVFWFTIPFRPGDAP